jgi:hypothetical protein
MLQRVQGQCHGTSLARHNVGSRRIFHMTAAITDLDGVPEAAPSGCDLVLDQISHRYGAGLAV